MPLQQIQPVWFDVDPKAAAFDKKIYALDMPSRWHIAIKRLPGDKSRNPPTRSLANTMQLFMTDVIRVSGWRRYLPSMSPWLLSWKSLDSDRIVMVFKAWLLESFPDNSDAERLANSLDPDELRWNEADWGNREVNRWDNGTSKPGGLFFDALPDLICESLANEVKIGGLPLPLLKARDNNSPSLVEWPPRRCPGNNESHRWSFCVSPSVQTIPRRAAPVVLLNVSVRKWVPEVGSPRLWTPDKNKGVYVRMKNRWLSEGSDRERLVRVNVAYRANKGDEWEAPFDRIVNRLSLSLKLPQPSELIEFPERYFEADELSMGMVMSTRMRRHHYVNAGVPQRDWMDVVESSQPALKKLGLTFGPKIDRVSFQARQRTDLRSVGNEKNAARRGRYGAATLMEANPRGMRFLILYQTEEARDALKMRLAEEFNRMNGLGFTTVCEWLGPEGAPLADDDERARYERIMAIQNRFAIYENFSCALVEIQGAGFFNSPETRDLGDPKNALRLGLAKAGLRSQFITVFDDSDDDKNREHRVENAVLDALRQTGYLPGKAFDDFSRAFHDQGNVQPDADLIGLWVKRHPDKWEYLPVFVRISQRDIWNAMGMGVDANGEFGQGSFDLARVPISMMAFPAGRMNVFEWRPYPDGLIALGRNEHKWLKSRDAEAFITSALNETRGNALLTVGSGNARAAWKWLSDKNLDMDNPQNIYAPNLRIARIRGTDADANEIPSWVAPRADSSASNPSGLFAFKDDRIYFSLHGASPAMIGMANPNASKADRPNSAFARPQLKEIALVSLCEGDGPREWAWLTHSLRHMSPTYDYAVSMPYPMHLARKAVDDYVIEG